MVEAAAALSRALEELSGVWGEVGARTDRYYAPGIPRDELARQLPFPLTPELAAWWGWRGGQIIEVPELGYECDMVPGGWCQITPGRCLEEIELQKDLAVGMDPDKQWQDTWVPVAMKGPWILLVDLGLPRGESHAVRFVDADMWSTDEVVADSLLEVLQLWLTVIRDGEAHYDATAGEWQADPWSPHRYPLV